MINVHIVDDYNLVLEGFKSILNTLDGINIHGCSSSGKSALESIDRNVDIMIADVSIGDITGIELTQKVLKKHLSIKVLAVSRFNDYSVIGSMIKAGVSGYIVKDEQNYDLQEALKLIYEGKTYFCPTTERILAQHKETTDQQMPDLTLLSKREIEVIKLVAKGMSNQAIAEHLFISVRTVETHRKNLMTKLKTNNAAGLVKFAFESKLMEI